MAIRYPGIGEYNQSAQHPATAFTDPTLAAGTVATSGLGLPIVLGGGFALTYTVTAAARKFAVRCFHRYVPDLEQRYAQISDAIGGLESEHFVAFEYQREGVRVASKLYPIVKMEWAEGLTLGGYIEDNYADGAAMRDLQQSFRELAKFLAGRGIAHGDLENGNLVVRDGGRLTLIDYDGMYVPGMALGHGNELGHAHFQHPGRTPDDFGPRIDDFSFILIDLSLAAVARDPSLYERFCVGDNILFQRTDFEAPDTSAVFQELRQMPDLADRIDAFAAICGRPIEQVPAFAAFLSGKMTGGPAPQRARPAGVSNIDYIRATLNKAAPGAVPGSPLPAGGQIAARSAVGNSVIPRAGSKSGRASTLQNAEDSRWSWWVTLSVFALIMLFVIKSLNHV